MTSLIQRVFGFDKSTMSLKREALAGVTTFLTMAYILAVNPHILGAAGMDTGAVFTASAIASIVATFVMAVYAKLPFALAPGMGLNAFFAYTIVLGMGYTWQFALTAVLIEGIIFIVMSLTGLRERIVASMPTILRTSIPPAIGLFIAVIGMKNAGIIVSAPATITTLGDVHSPQVILTLFGILLSTVLLVHKVPGALLIGILVVTLAGVPFGITHLQEIMAMPPSIEPILFQYDFENMLSIDMIICVFTLFFIDMFDTIGTLLGVSSRAGLLDNNGKMPRMKEAFMADALGTTVGSMLGTSTVSTFVESALGVEAGGRSGMTSLVTAACFCLALFFAPLFLAIPPAATAPALILVGVTMMCNVQKIDFLDYANSVPAFLCIIMMPMTSSISDGITIGMISYVAIRMLMGRWSEVNIGSYILAALFLLKFALL